MSAEEPSKLRERSGSDPEGDGGGILRLAESGERKAGWGMSHNNIFQDTNVYHEHMTVLGQDEHFQQ
jgi:hypothetical protein